MNSNIKLSAELCRGNIYSVEYKLPINLNDIEIIVNNKRIYPISYPRSHKEFLRITDCDQINQKIYQADLPYINRKEGISVHALWPNYVGYIPLKTLINKCSNIMEITLDTKAFQKIERGHKYRLINILISTLDSLQVGEYYYMIDTKTIYFKTDHNKPIVFASQSTLPNEIITDIHNSALSKSIITGENIVISNCTFSEKNGEGLVLNGAKNIVIKYCQFVNLSESGIMIINSSGILIDSCLFENCCSINFKHGVDVYIDHKSVDIKIINSSFKSSPKSGIQINSGDVTINNCLFDGTSWFGYYSGAITVDTRYSVRDLLNINITENYFTNIIITTKDLPVAGIAINSTQNIKCINIINNQFNSMNNSILLANDVENKKIVWKDNIGFDITELKNTYIINMNNCTGEELEYCKYLINKKINNNFPGNKYVGISPKEKANPTFEKEVNPKFEKEVNPKFENKVNPTFEKEVNPKFENKVNPTFEKDNLNNKYVHILPANEETKLSLFEKKSLIYSGSGNNISSQLPMSNDNSKLMKILSLVEPVLVEPVLEESVLEEPVLVEPVLEEPVLVEPVLVEPVLEEPVLTKPVLVEPELSAPIVFSRRW